MSSILSNNSFQTKRGQQSTNSSLSPLKSNLLKSLFIMALMASSLFVNAQTIVGGTGPSDDFDGDGIINSIDLDDDNDGILDAFESPSCFYSNTEMGLAGGQRTSILKISSALNLLSTTRPLINAIDNTGATATYTDFANAQTVVNKNVLTIEFISPVELDDMTLVYNSASSIFNSTATAANNTNIVIQGSNDNASWTDLAEPKLVGRAAETGNVNVFPITKNNGKYKYYRLTGTGTTGNTYSLGQIKDITFTASKYQASQYPKLVCDVDFDKDGIFNHFDLDSDNDGCNDAAESNVISHLVTVPLTGDVGANGFLNTLETSDNGVSKVTYTYNYALDPKIKACIDTDGDNIPDVLDIDDDNDGILDSTEGQFCLPPGLYYVGPDYFKSVTYQNIIALSGGTQEALLNALTDGNFGTFGANFNWTDQAKPIVVDVTLHFPVDADGFILANDNGVVGDGIKNARVKLYNEANVLLLEQYFAQILNTQTSLTPDKYAFSQKISGIKRVVMEYMYSGPTSGAAAPNYQTREMGLYKDEPFCTQRDTDGDGIPDHLDLDSDGDGCADSYEAGAVTTPVSTTVYTTGPDSNQNGLLDVHEDASTAGKIDYASDYELIALNKGYNKCLDTDNDGKVDLLEIDDDNDGVLDHVESPSCFMTTSDWNTSNKETLAYITSDLTVKSPLLNSSLLLDDKAGTQTAVQFEAAQSQLNKTIFKVNFLAPVKLSAWYIAKTSVTQIFAATAGSLMVQGSNDDATWTNLLTAPIASPANATNNIPFGLTTALPNSNKFTIAPTLMGEYKYYRIQGVAAATILGGVASEFYFDIDPATYHPSVFPRATCDTDTDGDKIPNHLDLDSDGDGCSDAIEAGSSTEYTSTSVYPNPTGDDANNNGLLTEYEGAIAGSVNYTSTYADYAIIKGISACADTDGDGIKDIIDIDDDNDGIPDSRECGTCFKGNASTELVSPISIVTFPVSQLTAASASYAFNGAGLSATPTTEASLSTITHSSPTLVSNAAYLNDGAGMSNDWKFTLAAPTDIKGMALWLPGSTAYGGGDAPMKKFIVSWTDCISGSIKSQTFDLGVPSPNAKILYFKEPIANVSQFTFDLLEVWLDQEMDQGISNGWEMATPETIKTNFNVTLGEIRFITQTKEYSVFCTLDTDGDGTPNGLDLDSDGDGCSDSIESGSSTTAKSTTAYASGDDVNTNGLLNNYEGTTAGTVNYTSTYADYALVDTINACADADGDGVPDVFDLDDDNDGILDSVECESTSYAESRADFITAAFHGTTWKGANGIYYVAGDKANALGTLASPTPFEITPANGYNYTGTIKFAQAFGWNSYAILTTTGFYTWGELNALNPTAAFKQVTLPSSIVPADVIKMSLNNNGNGTGINLTFVMKNGTVYSYSATAKENNGAVLAALSTSFTQVLKAAGTPLTNISHIETSTAGSFAYSKTDNKFYTWGSKVYLGDGTTTAAPANFAKEMVNPLPAGVGVVSIGANSAGAGLTYYVLGTDKRVYTMGYALNGVTGTGQGLTLASIGSWVNVKNVAGTGILEDVDYLSVQHAYVSNQTVSVIQTDGQLLSWGSNTANMTGLGTAVAFADLPTKPLGIAPGTKIIAVANGGHITPILRDDMYVGNVGHNAGGSFGDGTTADRSIYEFKPFAGNIEGPCNPDIDGDGIPNRLDLDSDGDGCSDANEFYGNTSAQGTDGNNYYGNGNPPAVNANGTVTASNYTGTYAAVTTAGSASVITAQPTDQSVASGANATFAATVTAGSGTTSYQWQVSTNGGSTWTNVTNAGVYTGATTATLTITGVTGAMNEYRYRLNISQSNYACGNLTTNAARLILSNNPKIIDNAVSVAEDTPVTGNVLTNDTGSGSPAAALTVNTFTVGGVTYNAGQTATIAGVGTITVNADGSFTFTPAANYNGQVPPITYAATDANGGTGSGTLNITVTPVNDVPVAVSETTTTPQDTLKSGSLLGNDTDADGDTLSITTFTVGGVTYNAGDTASIPGVGTIIVRADGTYTFTPAFGYVGAVPVIGYAISDGNGGTTNGTLTLSVDDTNDAPLAAVDIVTTTINTPKTGNVLTNDTDVDSSTLSVTQFTIDGISGTFTAGTTATIPGKGTIVVNADGSYTFTPVTGFTGDVPLITYTVTDGNSTDTADIDIYVAPVNVAPTAAPDTKTINEDTVATGNVLGNDTDTDAGTTLKVTEYSFTIGSTVYTYPAGSTASIPGVGVVVVNADGSYTFTPNANYSGAVPVISYKITDNDGSAATGGTATSTLSISVTAVNDSPVAVNDDNLTTPEDTPISGNVLSNDTDPEGNPITVTQFTIAGITGTFTAGTTATIPGVGTVVVNTDGSFTFTPVANYNGTVPTITYTARDSDGGTDTANLNLAVTPVNDAPIAVDDAVSSPEGTAATGNLLTNDTDADSDTKTVTSFTVGGVSYPAGSIVTIPNVGTIIVNADGTYTFTPEDSYFGTVPAIEYTVSDGKGGTATADLLITITEVDDAPIVISETISTPEDTPATGNVLDNDTDPEGEPLTVTGFNVGGQNYNAGQTATIPGVGTIVVNTDGSYTFTPAPNYNGVVPVIGYTVSDGVSTSNSSLNISVTSVNDAPVATDETASTPQNTAVTGSVLTNDTDVDGNTLTVTQFTIAGVTGTFNAGETATIPGVGTLVVNADGTYTFTPATNYYGPVPVTTYTVSDGNGGTDTGTLTLSVTPVDTDGDGVSDAQEAIDGTDPNNGCDYKVASQDPTKVSTEWSNADCDNDGLTNGEELTGVNNTSTPANPNGIKTDPLNADSDGDGVSDAQEAIDGTDPNDPCSLKVANQVNPSTAWNNADCDGDGIPNAIDGKVDTDGDGIPNFLDLDSDGDGIPDSVEKGTDPLNPVDTDGDGIPNFKDIDSDGDGNPDATDPNRLVPIASNDSFVAGQSGGNSTFNVLANDDYLPSSTITLARATGSDAGTAAGTLSFNALTGEMSYEPTAAELAAGIVTIGYQVCTGTVCDIAMVTIVYCDLSNDASDCDGDGVSNGQERLDGTDPSLACDYKASNQGTTSATWNSLDCDNDGLTNGEELTGIDDPATPANPAGEKTNPLNADSDGDGVSDAQEAIDGTDPNDGCDYETISQDLTKVSAAWSNGDCDNDGLTNGEELTGIDNPSTPANPAGEKTNPLNADSDGDGVSDAQEAIDGTDPNDGCDYKSTSQDATKVSTAWSNADCDNDGLTNGEELTGLDNPNTPADPNGKITDPRNTDTDGDGVSDAQEAIDGTDPNDGCDYETTSQDATKVSTAWSNGDCDGDGLTNMTEVSNGTNPINADTDGDGNPDNTDPNPLVPTAKDDEFDVIVGFPIAVNILTNDDYLANDANTITKIGGTAQGTVTFDPITGSMSYVPSAGESTGANTVTVVYEVCQGTGSTKVCATATVTLNIDVDVDGDGVGAEQEVIDVTDPSDPCDYNPESQLVDYVSDAWKAADCDGDGLSNGAELLLGTDPLNVDTDGDGIPDNLDKCPLAPGFNSMGCPIANDINVTNINVPVSGNVATNDVVPAGTTYGTPVAATTNPAGATITMNADGTYEFKATEPGVYTYMVPVCAPGQTTDCPLAPLQITVLEPIPAVNAPVVNPDVATTEAGTPVSIAVLNNDQTGNAGMELDIESLTITEQPENGTVKINEDGTITYTPNVEFTGTDVFTYQVCDTANPANCQTAEVTVTVVEEDLKNIVSATDDFAIMTSDPNGETSVSGNVLKNDGSTLSGVLLTPTLVTDPATLPGTLVFNTDGSYTFTPSPGFAGPVEVIYTVCDDATPANCATATLHILVEPAPQMPVDFNVTDINVPVSGSVATNDVVPAGTTYGTPVAATTNPAGATITMNADGTYEFKATEPGVYTYMVPVCAPGQTTDCPLSPLQITVLDPMANDNAPVVNPDIATAKEDSPVTIAILSNDQSGNVGTELDPTTVTITEQPENGTVTVNADGTVTFTPNAGFVGTDVFTYQVCDTSNPAICQTAEVRVTVIPADAKDVTTASDDYAVLTADPNGNSSVSGNVLTNDASTDPDAILTASLVEGPTAAQGTLVFNADGTYTFTAAPGFAGPVEVIYTVCDDATPANCATATLHILVEPAPQMPVDINVTDINVPVSGSVATNDVVPAGTTYGTPVAETTNPSGATITMNADGTYEFKATEPGVYTYMVPVCAPGQTTDCPMTALQITVLESILEVNPPVINPDLAQTKQDVPVKISVLANDKSGNVGTELVPSSLTITEQPENGTVTVNADGTVTFTPKAGFVGTDVFTYSVCDDSNPAICQTADVTVTVLPADVAPKTIASDDFESLIGGIGVPVSVSGNVLTNDGSTNPAAKLTASLVSGPTAEQGTLVFNADGTYTFTATPTFTGPVTVVYTVCDDATPANCATATLHILVQSGDSDGDGVSDAQEALDGTNPNDPCDYETTSQDLTKVSTAWKSLDCDGDGLTNNEELTGVDDPATPANPNGIQTDPRNPDSDGDGVSDAQEALDGTNPNDPCSFKPASQTLTPNDAWNNADCDGDGVTNGQEIIDGTDPTESCDSKPINVTLPFSASFLAGDCDGDGLSNGNEIGAIATNPQDVDKNGVPDYLEVTKYTVGSEELEVYNSLSPNGDGDNDTFIIRNIENYPNNTVSIYNRWGVLVFEVDGYGQNDKVFRGTSEGRVTIQKSEELPEGTYFYILRYANGAGVEKQRSGYLYIKR